MTRDAQSVEVEQQATGVIAPAAEASELRERAPLSELIDRRLAVRTMFGLVLVLVVVSVLGNFARGPITEFSKGFIEHFGAAGLAFGVWSTDTSPFPLINEPLFLFAYAGGMPVSLIWVLGTTASVLAGPTSYCLGMMIGHHPALQKWLDRTGVKVIMQRYGVVVVAVAAVTPVPFAACAWAAGASRVHFGKFMLACLGRYLKVSFFLALIILGWTGI